MQPSLLTWQAAPTIAGPRPTSADGTRPSRDYTAQWCAFVATDAGHAIAAALLATARAQLARGERRISVRKLLGDVAGVVPVSHNWTAPAADWLVTMEPRLGAVIERRKRTAANAVAP